MLLLLRPENKTGTAGMDFNGVVHDNAAYVNQPARTARRGSALIDPRAQSFANLTSMAAGLGGMAAVGGAVPALTQKSILDD
jgi:hypothetical protein